MKQILLILVLFHCSTCVFGQLLNGSFENAGNSDLSNWESACGAVSDSSTPQGGGNWSIKVSGGSTQGCFPGYAYQKIPSITNGESFVLSGWLKARGGVSMPAIGIYFGSINNNALTIQIGAFTTSDTWVLLSLQTSISLSAGDTAIVILDGGLVGGASEEDFGFFDQLSLQNITGMNDIEENQSLKLHPNPFNGQTVLKSENVLQNATLTIYNSLGQLVQKIENIKGQSITVYREALTNGIYFAHLSENDVTIATLKMSIID